MEHIEVADAQERLKELMDRIAANPSPQIVLTKGGKEMAILQAPADMIDEPGS